MGKLKDKISSFHLDSYVNTRAFMLMLAGFLMLSLFISFSIVLVTRRDRKAVEATLLEQTTFIQSLDSSTDLLRLDDFILPEQANIRQTKPHLQREPQRLWSAEEIEKYWIELEDTGVGEISEYNRSLIESLLGESP